MVANLVANLNTSVAQEASTIQMINIETEDVDEVDSTPPFPPHPITWAIKI